jgi:hypothetical protein
MSEPNKDTVRIPLAPAPDHFGPGPKKDTARIAILPRATPAARPVAAVDSIPKPYVWTIFGLAALIFLIQIWNFLVS